MVTRALCCVPVGRAQSTEAFLEGVASCPYSSLNERERERTRLRAWFLGIRTRVLRYILITIHCRNLGTL